MKRLLQLLSILFAAGIFITACNTNPVTAKGNSYEDTVGFAEFQAVKMAEFNAWKAMNKEPGLFTHTVIKKSPSSGNEKIVMTSSSTNEAKVAKKKGWSKAAKYSVIGGVSGATLGAVINKKDRVKGGVIGGVVLGGLGYILGRSEDKKDSRY